MSKNNNCIRIVLKKKKYYYKLPGEAGNEYEMGSAGMYNEFLKNNADCGTGTESFFNVENDLSYKFLSIFTDEQCPLYIDGPDQDIALIEQSFEIIIFCVNKNKRHNASKKFKNNMLILNTQCKSKAKYYKSNKVEISQKFFIATLLESLAEAFLIENDKGVITKKNLVRTTETSFESSLQNLRIGVNYNAANAAKYLSSLDSSVFVIVRNFCRKSIGEGTKVEEVTARGIEMLRMKFQGCISKIKADFRRNDVDFNKLNSSKKDSHIIAFNALCRNPVITRNFLTILAASGKLCEGVIDLKSLIDIFGTTKNYVFSDIKREGNNFIAIRSTITEILEESKSSDSDSDDEGGGFFSRKPVLKKPGDESSSSDSESENESESDSESESESENESSGYDSLSDDIPGGFGIIENKHSSFKETTNPDLPPELVSSGTSRSHPIGRSRWLKSSSTKDPVTLKKTVLKSTTVTDTKLSKKVESETIIEEDSLKIVINLKNLSSLINILHSQRTVDIDNEFYERIISGSITKEKEGIKLDWWQKDFKMHVVKGESVILVGDTSGGKTFIAISSIRDLYMKISDSSSDRIVYIAPTSQLAILQFSNMLTMYPDDSRNFGIACKSITDIPPTWKVLFGTPTFVKRVLINSRVKETVSDDKFREDIQNALSQSEVINCSTLFIDEVQTLSPKYVENQEIEYKKECKNIEDILYCCRRKVDGDFIQGQVVCISATLSNDSIVNLKRKISLITKIPDIHEVKYSHNDIGLVDKSLEDTYVPIMKKPDFFYVKTTGVGFESYKVTDRVEQQVFNNENLETIIRDARDSDVFPLSIFTENELSTVQLFKNFLNYVKRKCSECTQWNSLYRRHSNEHDFSVYKTETKTETIVKKHKELLEIITLNIRELTGKILSSSTRLSENENEVINRVCDLLEISSPFVSPELYGLCYEYEQLYHWNNPFTYEVHPFYRYGGSYSGDLFSLTNSAGNKTDLCKILESQDADVSNERSIIPLILEGFKYGMSIITSSIPLGFQLEIFKFINIKSKLSGGRNPIPILFSEYVMSMGMNLSTMSIAILYRELINIGVCEFLQMVGRAGRRGNSNQAAPKIYTFNVANIGVVRTLEDLDFDIKALTSDFFEYSEIIDTLCNIMVKYDTIADEISNISSIDTIINGSTFKFMNTTSLTVRKIQLAKFQLIELYSRCRNIFPSICDSILVKVFKLLQKAEFHYINDQIN